MFFKKSYLLLIASTISAAVFAQEEFKVDYSAPAKTYEIADISVTGTETLERSTVISFSELAFGQKITIPGDDITNVVKRFWKLGLFANVKVSVEKIEGDKIWLNIAIEQHPKVSEIRYNGVKKSQREDLETQVALTKGGQLTPNLENQARKVILKYFAEKGYHNAEVNILKERDISLPGSVIVTFDIDKKTKIKVKKITIEGNKNLSNWKINRAMKKTNESGKIWNIFSAKKFVNSLYEADKKAVIDKYNEIGYRDAVIEKDSVSRYDDEHVNVYLKINEGKKYYFRHIRWTGNTLYSSDLLNQMLRIKRGDVYNGKLLNERLIMDEDAVANLYQDNGYLFSNIDPVETNIDGDSIDFEMRIFEGKQAVINKVGISGNTRVYDHVVRRELRTKPGQLYSKSDIMRTLREIAQMGFFDPEKLQPDIQPDPENGTVDINYPLETKSNDQVELSLGYGATGVTGSLGLTFNNFAIQNLFKPSTYKIVPQGEGQRFSIKGTTNGKYYTTFSASFLDPWFGKKRPNSLSLSAYYAMQNGFSDRSVNNEYLTNPYYYATAYGNNFAYEIDPDKYIHIFGASLGWGTRLKWPDDYFTFNAAINYQHYTLSNWNGYLTFGTGTSNSLSLGLTLSRNSIDNPIYTRSGSSISLSVDATPPYSAITGKDYSAVSETERYQWIEYHKWKLKAKFFIPLTHDQKLVLSPRIEYGFLGYFNKNRRSPFQQFVVGGSGLTGSSSSFSTDIVGLRGYSDGALTPYDSKLGYDNLYTRISLELRYPIVTEGSTTIYVLGFLEGGNSWKDFSDFNPFNLKRSAGVGVRLFLPMFGLMGVDWGWGFDPVKGETKPSGSQFNFILGQEF